MQLKITDYFVSSKSKTTANSIDVSKRNGTKKSVDTTVSSDSEPQKQISLNTPKRKLIEEHEQTSESSDTRRKDQQNCKKKDAKTCDKIAIWLASHRIDPTNCLSFEQTDSQSLRSSQSPQSSKSNCESVESFLSISKDRDDDNNVVNIDAIKRNTSPKITKGILKGLSSDFVKKFQTLQNKSMEEMTRKPDIEEQKLMTKRLPEFIRIIHAHFITDNMPMPYDELIETIRYSYRNSISVIDTKAHLEYLMKLLPDWIFVVTFKESSFVKLFDIKKNIKDLEHIIDNHEHFLSAM